MEVNSIVRLRRAALLAGAFTALLAAAMPSLADNDRDDERCAGNKALRLVNGRIHTMDAKDRIVSSVLIRNGRFAAVGHGDHDGDDDCVREIDLRGRTAVPGIIDSHNHIILLPRLVATPLPLPFLSPLPPPLTPRPNRSAAHHRRGCNRRRPPLQPLAYLAAILVQRKCAGQLNALRVK